MLHPHPLFLLSAIVLSFALTSCEKSEGGLEVEEVRSIVLKADVTPMTKATETSFEASDEVGVIIRKNNGEVYADNNKFVYSGGVLRSSDGLEWYDGNTQCKIVAYYPYVQGHTQSARYNYNVATDQSSYESYIGSDLLVGIANNVAPGASAVNISFNHLCTQFHVSVTNQSSEVIQSVVFPDLQYHQSLFTDFSAVSGDGVASVDITPYHQTSGGADVYKAFVPSVQTTRFKVRIVTDTGTRLFQTSEAFSFDSGMIYMVNITLQDGGEAQEVSVIPQFVNWKTSSLTVYGEGEEPGENGDDPEPGNSYFATYQEMYQAAGGKTYTTQTPMGTHYIGKHVTTEADRTWLLNPANEPELLPSAPSYTLKEYPVTLYPFSDPKPADVNQHGIGDCSACAVLAEMAYVAPGFIKSIITDNGDNTYTVKMYDPQGQQVNVCVSNKFLGSSSIGAVSGKNNVACWSTVMEKAMMKWEAIYQVNPDVYGIGSEHVLPLFTGNGDSFAFYPGNLTALQLKAAVELAFSSKCLIIGGFTQSGAYVGTSQTVSGHAYSFHKDTGTNAMFAMRNPWGYSPGDSGTYTDGLLHITSNGTVPSLIDIRVICPGALESYYLDTLEPYTPPTFAGAAAFQQFLLHEREKFNESNYLIRQD